MIENSSGAINIERRPEFLGNACKIDIFTVKAAVSIKEKMHARM
jgi:hypothetical protein